MKLEFFLGIVFFLIYVAAIMLKRISGKSKAGGKGILRPAWKEKLDGFLSQARQEMAASSRGSFVKTTGWERFLPQKDDAPEPLQDKRPHEKAGRVKEKTPSLMIRPAPVEAAAKSPVPIVPGKKISPRDLPYAKEDLRKAIIWSEILAPPLALREDR